MVINWPHIDTFDYSVFNQNMLLKIIVGRYWNVRIAILSRMKCIADVLNGHDSEPLQMLTWFKIIICSQVQSDAVDNEKPYK